MARSHSISMGKHKKLAMELHGQMSLYLLKKTKTKGPSNKNQRNLSKTDQNCRKVKKTFKKLMKTKRGYKKKQKNLSKTNTTNTKLKKTFKKSIKTKGAYKKTKKPSNKPEKTMKPIILRLRGGCDSWELGGYPP